MSRTTTTSEFFDAKYQVDADPWNFASSGYELQRYSEIIASLGSRQFKRAFEPGCSIGVLTERLGAFCERVEAIDVSGKAVERAIQRCRHLANIHIDFGSLADSIPEGEFDLIILSEIGYYFEPSALSAIGRQLASQLAPGGILLAAHWLGSSVDHLLSGDEVHRVLESLPGLAISFAQRHPGYRVTHWTKQ